MAILLPQAQINFLTTSQFQDKLKVLYRNTPSKPWIRQYDDPVQLVWASPSELRSQRQVAQVQQHSQQLQQLSSSVQLQTHQTNKGKRGRPSKEAIARKGGKHVNVSKSRSSSSSNISNNDAQHQVYVISPSSINESNLFVNNVPVLMQTVQNDHTNLSPTFLPSAITGGHELQHRYEKGSKTDKVQYSQDAQTIDKRVRDKTHSDQRLFASKLSSLNSKQHKASQHSKSYQHSQKKHKLQALQQVQQKLPSQQLVNKQQQQQQQNERQQMYNNIEFTPSSAEVRQGSVEILSSPPPVMTIRQRPRKTNTKKASSSDDKTKTRQRRLQSNTDNDNNNNNNNKVQLPMERFLRRS